MATEVERMIAVLEARTSQFEKAMDKAAGVASARGNDIQRTFTRLNPGVSRAAATSGGTLATALVGGFAGGLAAGVAQQAVQAFVGIVQSSFRDLAKIKDVATAAGATVEQVQVLRYALQQSGGDANAADAAFQKFTSSIGEASTANGFLYKLLRLNGVALRDSSGQLRSTGDLFSEVANLIANTASPQERLNLASQVFGSSAGPALVRALSGGADGLNRFGQEARQAGVILQESTIDKAAEVDQAWSTLVNNVSTRLKGMVVDAVAAFDTVSKNAVVAAKLAQDLPLTMEELAYAIELARSKGSPVDPAWIAQLEALKAKATETAAAVKAAMSQIAAKDGIDITAPAAAGGASAPAQAAPAPAANAFPTPRPRGTTQLPYNYKADENEFTRAMQQSQKRREAIQAEMATLDKGTLEQEKARAALELTTAAKQAHIGMTDALRAKIDQEATAYAQAAYALEQARASQQRWLDLQQELGDLGVSSIQGLIEGTKSFNDVLKDGLSLITQMILKATLLGQGPLAGLFGGSVATSNSMGGLLGMIFGGFRAGGGPVANGRSYIVGEKGPELFTPGTSGAITPNNALPRMGGGQLQVGVSVDDDGKIQAYVKSYSAAAAQQGAAAGASIAMRAAPGIARSTFADDTKRRGR